MNTFDILVDSAANLTDEMVATTGIKVVPFLITVDGKEVICYQDGKSFTDVAREFYKKLRQGAEVKTTLVNQARFEEVALQSLKQDRDVIIITLSEGISGTFAQAKSAAKNLSDQFPQRKVFAVDSANASMGEGLLALLATKLRDEGKTAQECVKVLEDSKYKINSYVAVDDLKYLRKGGRVSTVAAIAGAILNIKPMLKADAASPAKLSVYAKEKGRKKSIEALVRAFSENAEDIENQLIVISHCDCEEEANALAEKLKEVGAKNIVIEYYDLCTGTHVGPGTIALFFFGKDRRQKN